MSVVRVLACAATCLLAACGGEDETEVPPTTPEPAVDCQPGELARADGTCQPAGVPSDMPCPPGEVDDGGCRPAGVGSCPAGFELASDGGCAAILPSAPCLAGTMALPGETSCRPVAACGSGTWGDIDVSGNTEFVDESFVGTSLGTSSAPWISIGDAVVAASNGATIAVAAGTYDEDVLVQKALTIWGVCPENVEVVGQGGLGTFYLRGGASGTTLRGMSVTGTDIGVLVTGATDVVVEEMRVHDTGFRAVDIENSAGATSVTIVDSLVEGGVGEGIFQGGGVLTLERSVVRNSQPEASGFYGRGLGAQVLNGQRANMTVTDCVFEDNHEAAITVIGSDGVIDNTLLRNTLPMPGDGTAGWGLWLNHDGPSMNRSATTVRGSVIEQSHDSGVALVGSDATIEGTTVRASQAAPGSPYSGMGIVVRNKYTLGERAVLTLDSSVVTRSQGIGMYLLGSDATVIGSAIVDTEPSGPNPGMVIGGRGVSVEPDPLSLQSSTFTMSASRVANNYEHGVFVGGSEVTLDATAITDIMPDVMTGKYGRGLNVQLDTMLPQFPPKATVSRCLFERTHEVAVAVLAATATIEESTIRDTQPRPMDMFGGRAVIVQYAPGTNVPASASLKLVLAEHNPDIGVAVVSSTATIEACVVRDTRARPDGLFGDGISALEVSGTSGTHIGAKSTRIESSARAGLSNFSGTVTLADMLLDCNQLSLASQTIGAVPAKFEDAGDNQCSCQGEDLGCKASSTAIEPPQQLED